MSEKGRREELLRDPALTLRNPALIAEFIGEHTLLMQRFEPLRQAIATGEIDPTDIAMSVLREHDRLAQRPMSKKFTS